MEEEEKVEATSLRGEKGNTHLIAIPSDGGQGIHHSLDAVQFTDQVRSLVRFSGGRAHFR